MANVNILRAEWMGGRTSEKERRRMGSTNGRNIRRKSYSDWFVVIYEPVFIIDKMATWFCVALTCHSFGMRVAFNYFPLILILTFRTKGTFSSRKSFIKYQRCYDIQGKPNRTQAFPKYQTQSNNLINFRNSNLNSPLCVCGSSHRFARMFLLNYGKYWS